jgi:hypothetical protein
MEEGIISREITESCRKKFDKKVSMLTTRTFAFTTTRYFKNFNRQMKNHPAEKIIPRDNDVLKGRGAKSHPGNVHFRLLVQELKEKCVKAPFHEKPFYAECIINKIKGMDPPGRFLAQDKDTKQWIEISDEEARFKTRQALREGARDILNKKEQQEETRKDDEVSTLNQ